MDDRHQDQAVVAAFVGVGALVIAAVAGAVAAFRGFDTPGWIGGFGRAVATATILAGLVVFAAAIVAVAVGSLGFGAHKAVGVFEKHDEAKMILPALLAALSGVLTALAKDFMPDDKPAKWTVTILAQAITLIGATLVYLGNKRGAVIASAVLLGVAVAYLVLVAFTTPLWDKFRALPGGSQAMLTGAVLAWLATIGTAAALGMSRRRKAAAKQADDSPRELAGARA